MNHSEYPRYNLIIRNVGGERKYITQTEKKGQLILKDHEMD